MTRIGSALLALALVVGVVWVARHVAGETVTPDAAWTERNASALRRIVGLPPSAHLEFELASASRTPDFYNVRLSVMSGGRRQPLDLLVSRDGKRVFYGRPYSLADPFADIRVQIRLADAPARGAATAPLTMVEYVDYTCGFCRQFADTVEAPLLERYAGRVRIVYKNFPLTGLRAWSADAAAAAACAYQQDNDKFLALHDKLFRNQPRLKEGRPLLASLAREAGLDWKLFSACLEDPQTEAALARDVAEGDRVGVTGTPTFFLNGRPIAGARPAEMFYAVVDEELAAAAR
jgi:protein-disulfide isomerase